MENFNAVADVLGYKDTSNFYVAERVRKICRIMTANPNDEGFNDDVERAEAEVTAEGANAFSSMFGAIMAAQEPKERVYKIKQSVKGTRIEAVSASGVRFAFGEVWCNSVKAQKGIAVNENNREKLNMHGTHMGVPNPETMAPRELCAAIAALM